MALQFIDVDVLLQARVCRLSQPHQGHNVLRRERKIIIY